MRIAIVSDAWRPQINGVVRTLETVARILRAEGHEVEVFGPDRFRTLPCPTYPEIRLSLFPSSRLSHMLQLFAPDAIHIVTEGPLGWAARGFCRRRGIPFTTAYHTRFPEYVRARIRVPLSWSYAFVRWFHAPSAGVLVVSPAIRDELSTRGFRNLVPWSRGVDITAFKPQRREDTGDPRPIWLYAGRVAVEKNIEAFLGLDLPGTKWVVGGGPQLKSLQRRYANVRFFGSVDADELSYRYAQADCFVFPSVTDTFGLVMVEALASGVPVAGYPVPGPLDVVTDSSVGALDKDLRTACLAAVSRNPEDCRRHAETFTWERCARQFLEALQVIPRHHWQPLRNRVLPDAAAP
ncbi:glycosyltransferase family 1 protein [Reyranella sp.]|uniref:glycosyltransferase family 4 protein n=1 Tax=Reyranella sp. TaxID=1929291 RepID=UPI000BD57DC0|nr:glycosyltransferase family 1 protein [Reyranella sp.]OYY39926.1 MAG: alpha-mannosyltransferase [Rhodospirillales bacterium 35-66-84]OYZ92370.1 MAG: alpha-mannosyltransferase [Rhodospirillales bacterium 24-66-33]OZB22164.1 MAG: alpha-mannosyltransferase [Rhodospirillales bacterium 39-66-50]HQS17776.1 glycosyltransferase family 1 protein [Reyranella sp.]HQT14061.1 glycosyltransferase family 1 protein [Reyranella sp.]